MMQQIYSHPDRRARYNQALINAGTAFMVVLLAAQSFKAGRERRKVQAELGTVQEESAKRLALLQSLFEDDVVDKMIDAIVHARSSSSTSTSTPPPNRSFFAWWTKSTTTDTVSVRDKKVMSNALLNELNHLIGKEALDEAQRETLRMRLQMKASPPPQPTTAAAAVTKVDDAVTKMSSSTPPLPDTSSVNGGTSVTTRNKRVPFTM
jgi:hypothetical protein